jgi:hypothetical protein
VETSGLSLAFLLPSFRSLASLLICLSPALDIEGFGLCDGCRVWPWGLHGPHLSGYVMVFMNYYHDLCRGIVYMVGCS